MPGQEEAVGFSVGVPGAASPEVADLVRPGSGDNCEAILLTISCLEERNMESTTEEINLKLVASYLLPMRQK